MWILESTCYLLQRGQLGFWWGLQSLCISLETLAILTMLSLPVHEYEMFLHLFRSFFLFSNNVYGFQSVSFVFLLLNFFPVYSFNAIINEIVFLILFSDFSFQAFRNIIDFCVFILYYATFLNLLVVIGFNEFLRSFNVQNHIICD